MTTTPLPSVEEVVEIICEYKQGRAALHCDMRERVTQDRTQAYTSLVEGIEEIKFEVDTYYAEDVMVVDIKDLKEKIDILYGKE